MSKHHNKHKPQKQPHHKGTSTGHSPAATPAPSAAAAPLSLTDPHAWRFEALDTALMVKTYPGLFCAGEMLDWEAPTGGYLLTGCLSTGYAAGQGARAWLQSENPVKPALA